MKQNITTNTDKNSVTGIANHIPLILKTNGNNNIDKLKKTNVLRNIIIEATFPLENAVNIAAEKMFIPVNKNATAKIKKPFSAI